MTLTKGRKEIRDSHLAKIKWSDGEESIVLILDSTYGETRRKAKEARVFVLDAKEVSTRVIEYKYFLSVGEDIRGIPYECRDQDK